jgi:hypothetical protein
MIFKGGSIVSDKNMRIVDSVNYVKLNILKISEYHIHLKTYWSAPSCYCDTKHHYSWWQRTFSAPITQIYKMCFSLYHQLFNYYILIARKTRWEAKLLSLAQIHWGLGGNFSTIFVKSRKQCLCGFICYSFIPPSHLANIC